MPGYIHTCGNCGAHMQVHERYLGRTLRCTSCRTEFEAALPEGVVVDEPVPTQAASEAPTRSATRFLPWLLRDSFWMMVYLTLPSNKHYRAPHCGVHSDQAKHER